METLTANASGILKTTGGATPQYRLIPGRRYALQINGTSSLSAGEVQPLIDGYAIPDDATDANNAVSWTCSLSAPASVGCEFVATGNELTIAGTGFAEGGELYIALVPVED